MTGASSVPTGSNPAPPPAAASHRATSPAATSPPTYPPGSRARPRENSWPCYGAVVLHRPASYVLPFAGDGIVEDLGGDRCSIEVGSWSWTALAAALNRFDADIDVIGPAELADAFAQLAARNSDTVAHYEREHRRVTTGELTTAGDA